MKKALSLFTVVLLFLIIGACAPRPERRPPPPPPQAVSPAERISQRIAKLQLRIDEGVRSGSLTEPESRELQGRLDTIRRDFDRAKANRLAPPEIDSISGRLDALERDTFREKRDPARRY